MRIPRLTILCGLAAGLAVACGQAPGPTVPDSPDPLFSTTDPPSRIGHDEPYRWQTSASDPGGGPVSVRAPRLPSWLSFDSVAVRLEGTPGEENIGSHEVLLIAHGAGGVTNLRFTIDVVIGRSSLQYDGSWIQGTGGAIIVGHDGNPHTTEHFVIYSDFASPEARVELGELLEDVFATIKDSFDVKSDDEFLFSRPGGKIHILADKLHASANGWAYRDGLIVMSPDAPRYRTQGYTPARYRGLVTHELTHVVEFLLLGPHNPLHSTDAWQREGVATYMAGLAPGGAKLISTEAEVGAWRSRQSGVQDGGNPISVHAWSDFPASVLNSGQTGSYYAIFALAVQYLVDPAGAGGSLADMKQAYLDIRGGATWATALSDRFGVDLADYEAEFWTLMAAYLP